MESRIALAVRDALYDAVARVVAGGLSEQVDVIPVVGGYTSAEVALDVERGCYLATWGRPVTARFVSGPGGADVVVAPKAGAS